MTDYINLAFRCVVDLTKKYNIDESHSLKHSMEVKQFANDIYESELASNPHLADQKMIIVLSAILHDMCDKKYVDEIEGLAEIERYMRDFPDFPVIAKIITTMSYSKVKKNGYPDLGIYQLAYHIVREADLLAAYDIDRCIIFAMAVHKMNYTDAVDHAYELFKGRVMKYIDDGLFVTEYSKRKAGKLHKEAGLI